MNKLKSNSNLPTFPKQRRAWIRIIAVFLAFSVLILFTFDILRFQLKQTLEKEIDVYTQHVSRRSAAALKQDIQSDFNMLKGLSIALSAVDDLDIEYWIEKLNSQGLFSEFQRIGFILPNMKGYAKGVDGVDLSDREYASLSLAGHDAISDLLVDKITGNNIIFYSVPIFNNDKVVAAVSFGTFASKYEHSLDLSSYEQGDYSFVANSDGGIILRSTHEALSGDKTSLFSVAQLSSAVKTEVLANMKSGLTATFAFIEDGAEKHVIYTPVGIKDWYLITIVPDKLIVEKSTSIRNLSILLGALLAGIGLSFAAYIYRKQRTHEFNLQKLAYIDPLTNGFNKNGFVLQAEDILSRHNDTYALVIADIDKFKLLNDVFGYKVGDAFLQHMADVIRKELEPGETFGRINADRFDALLRFNGEAELSQRLERILEEIVQFQFPDNAVIHLVVNAGVYLVEDNRLRIAGLCDKASLALDKAKRLGYSEYVVYDDAIRDELVAVSELQADIESAFTNNEFSIVVQPKYDINSWAVVGGEVLVRWNHPKRGMVRPDLFVPLMEESGLITKLDMFVLDEACKVQHYLNTVSDIPLPISVNQSKRHLYDPEYVEKLLAILQMHQVQPGLIELELTETVFFEDTTALINVSKILRNHGFKISIDDFGTGYSSLNMLKDVTVDVLKLDKAFLDNAVDEDRGRSITASVIAMSKKLNIQTVAEGVETIEQVEFLKEIGCDIAQGYYFSRPISVYEFQCLMGAPCQ